jgi:uncharacterized protein (DUF885 family)
LRDGPGLIHQPNGLKLYHDLLEYHTTIQGINPEDIYAMGQEQIRFVLNLFKKILMFHP